MKSESDQASAWEILSLFRHLTGHVLQTIFPIHLAPDEISAEDGSTWEVCLRHNILLDMLLLLVNGSNGKALQLTHLTS